MKICLFFTLFFSLLGFSSESQSNQFSLSAAGGRYFDNFNVGGLTSSIGTQLDGHQLQYGFSLLKGKENAQRSFVNGTLDIECSSLNAFIQYHLSETLFVRPTIGWFRATGNYKDAAINPFFPETVNGKFHRDVATVGLGLGNEWIVFDKVKVGLNWAGYIHPVYFTETDKTDKEMFFPMGRETKAGENEKIATSKPRYSNFMLDIGYLF